MSVQIRWMTFVRILMITIQGDPTSTPRRIHIDSTWILRGYVEDQISTNFHVISAYLFDVISLVEKSTSFSRTFSDVISLVKKSTLFLRTLFDVILMVEKSTLFLCTFIGVISLDEKSTLFPHTFFDVISIVEKSRLFPRTLFNVISMVVSTYFYWFDFEICALFLLTFFDVI